MSKEETTNQDQPIEQKKDEEINYKRYLTRPHDALFKDTLSKKENARSFLENYLPKPILERIELSELEICKDSYISKELEEFYSDLVYKVKISNREGYIYLLFEHKSYYEIFLPFQLLEYMVNLWRLKIKQHVEKEKERLKNIEELENVKNAKFKLPMIIPLVIYHGKKRQAEPLKLSEIVDITEFGMKMYIPDFEYHLYDFPSYQDKDLKGNIETRLMEWLFKYIRRTELKEKFIEFLKSIPKEKVLGDFIITAGIYIIATKRIPPEVIMEIYNNYVSDIKGEKVMGTLQLLVAEGIKKGKQEGIKEGILEILEERFGEIPEKVANAVMNIGNLEKLSFLHKRAITIEDMEEFSRLLNKPEKKE